MRCAHHLARASAVLTALYNGFIPTMEQGDIMGHEFMGEVVEVGRLFKQEKLKGRVIA